MLSVREFSNISMIKGPLIYVQGVTDASYNELVEIEMPNGEKRRGLVIDSQMGIAIVQVFEGTTGVSPTGTKIRMLGRGLEVKISEEMLGRIFNPLGDSLDNGPPVIKGERYKRITSKSRSKRISRRVYTNWNIGNRWIKRVIERAKIANI